MQTFRSRSVMPQRLFFPPDLPSSSPQVLPVPSSLHQQTPFPLVFHPQCLV